VTCWEIRVRDVEDFIVDNHIDQLDAAAAAYSRKVGERLRSIRRQKRLSLQDVEAASHDEFKASVLGAYERGERAISVPRLERLARFYQVPVEQLLPREDFPVAEMPDVAPVGGKLAIDLVKLSQMAGQPFEMLLRFLRMIQVQRQDFNGRVLTVRGHDTRAMAAMLDVPVDDVPGRLEALDLLYRPD
jgi:transcriptional regulator with XRE-family HTH domain